MNYKLKSIVLLLVVFLSQEIVCQRRKCSPSSSFTSPSSSSNSTEKLKFLGKKLSENQLNGYLIPLTDEHLSEDISEGDNRLKFMTGFTGSNGLALILDTLNNGSMNVFFTDSRYGEAADEQLDCNWIIHVCPDLLSSAIQYIKAKADPGSKIAADVRLFSLKDWMKLNEVLQSCGHSVIPQSYNLIDEIWAGYKPGPGQLRPGNGSLFIHDISFSGKSWQEKVSEVMTEIESRGGQSLIVSNLEEVAWLLNLRGNEIDYLPIFKSYVVIVSRNLVWLFVDESKVTNVVREHLNICGESSSLNPGSLNQEPCVVIKDYKEFLWSSIEVINAVTSVHNSTVVKILIPELTNYYVYGMIPEQFKVSISESPIARIKCIKNDIEVNGMKSAHVRDAVALIDFMARLSSAVTGRSPSKQQQQPNNHGQQSNGQVIDGLEQLDELSVTRLLTRLRLEQKNNRGESFETISAVDDNASKAHYSPTNTSSRTITIDSIYLIDSGGQYLDGTTDVTRVMVFNDEDYLEKSSSEGNNRRRIEGLKQVYTRILMGMIDMSSMVFPAEVKARDLSDVLARRHLAQIGLTYGHGTSHGIGSYLAVHENSIYISSQRSLNIPLAPGMFTSIEPGFYEPGTSSVRIWTPGQNQSVTGESGRKSGGFGMRLENIVQVIEAELPQLVLDPIHGPINGHGSNFLTFEPVTLVPFERRLINYDLLGLDHKKWLNRYNSRIRLIVGRELREQNRSLAFDWMMDSTEPIIEIETDHGCLQSTILSSSTVVSSSTSINNYVLCDFNSSILVPVFLMIVSKVF